MKERTKNVILALLALLAIMIMCIFLLNLAGFFNREVETYEFHATVLGARKTGQGDYRVQFVDGDETGYLYLDSMKRINYPANKMMLVHATITEDLFGNERTYYRIGN